MKNFLKQDTLILVLVGITISAFGIMVPILYSPTELGATNINNSIQFLTLLVGIVTIAYVMKTFQLQRKEIIDNRRDSDFNRAVDMIYKHTQYTKDTLTKAERAKNDYLRSIENYQQNIRLPYKELKLSDTFPPKTTTYYKWLLDDIYHLLGTFLVYEKEIEKAVKFYIKIVYDSNFNKDDVIQLNTIIRETFYNDIILFLESHTKVIAEIKRFDNEIDNNFRIEKDETSIGAKRLRSNVQTVLTKINRYYKLFSMVDSTDYDKRLSDIRDLYGFNKQK